jgi:hypothetical protein
MIRLDRAYLLMPRSIAVGLLCSAGVATLRLDLHGLHEALRRQSPEAQALLDRMLVVEDADAATLSARMQEEYGRDLPRARRPRRGELVVPRSIAVLKLPDLACGTDVQLSAELGRCEGASVIVVPDRLIAGGIAAFNRHVREGAPHGHSLRLVSAHAWPGGWG